jgi:hypothetical protein
VLRSSDCIVTVLSLAPSVHALSLDARARQPMSTRGRRSAASVSALNQGFLLVAREVSGPACPRSRCLCRMAEPEPGHAQNLRGSSGCPRDCRPSGSHANEGTGRESGPSLPVYLKNFESFHRNRFQLNVMWARSASAPYSQRRQGLHRAQMVVKGRSSWQPL